MKKLFNNLKFFGGGLLLAYVGWLRPRLARWQVSDAEVRGPHLGDDLLPNPLMQINHAVTIEAPAETAWQWIVQVGYGRGGFYSYDWLERAAGLVGLRSAEEIDPGLQKLKVGDTVKISPVTPMTVEVFKPGRALVLRTVMSPFTAQALDRRSPPEPWMDWTWAFLVQPDSHQRCRLISRVRASYAPYFALWPLMALLAEPAAFVMDRKLLLTVKERSEKR
jgi:hypothetical protein